jgi:hypothetical protein
MKRYGPPDGPIFFCQPQEVKVVIPVAVYAWQPEQRGNSSGWAGLAVLAAVAAVLLVVALRGGRKGKG